MWYSAVWPPPPLLLSSLHSALCTLPWGFSPTFRVFPSPYSLPEMVDGRLHYRLLLHLSTPGLGVGQPCHAASGRGVRVRRLGPAWWMPACHPPSLFNSWETRNVETMNRFSTFSPTFPMSALHGMPSQHQTMPRPSTSHSLCVMLLQLLVVQQLLSLQS